MWGGGGGGGEYAEGLTWPKLNARDKTHRINYRPR
jgi:hypothetical protein